MLIVARPAGQLGNQLFQFAHFVALAAETRVTVANPAFGYAAEFPAFAGDALCRYPRPRRRVPPALRVPAAVLTATALRGARLLPLVDAIQVPDSVERDLGDQDLRARAARRGIVLASGWQLRAYAAFARQRDEIRRVFTPGPRHVAAAETA